MEFNVKSVHPEKQKTGCLIVAIYESGETWRLSSTAKQIDRISSGYIVNILKKGDLKGTFGQTLLLHHVPNLPSDRLLLVGCGKEREFGEKQYKKIISKVVEALNQIGSTDAICFLSENNVKGRDIHWKIQQAVIATYDTLYQFDTFKTKKNVIRRPLRHITFTVPTRRELPKGEMAIVEGQAISRGIYYARDLGNTPANICTPTFLSKEATKLAKKYKHLSAASLGKKELQALGMNALLAVAQGSAEPPKLITMEYRGSKEKAKPIVLVGKGITFDTGGNSLKPAANMIGMKYDMCGAASVFGTLVAAAELELPLNIIGVVPSAENMPGGTAIRPDDIITTLAGISVEILNTDAEGRLILCDALTYSERFDPEVVIDIATLTGACVVALGRHYSALYANHKPLAHDLFTAGQISGDKCWQMPLSEEYQEQLDSNFADIANIGGPEAGSITAASFLARFSEKYHWAHLDVAGTACRFTGKEKAATGRPVGLLTEYLLQKCRSLSNTE